MSLSNPNKPVTEERLQEFYHKIAPYMGNGGGGTGGGHTIEDSEGTELTQRDTLQFGDGLNVSDDSTNGKTVVEPNLMVASDMDDVVTPLPSVQSRYHKYSTEEQIVGEWIDGKPIYQRTFAGTTPSTSRTNIVLTTEGNYKAVIDYNGYIEASYGNVNIKFWDTVNGKSYGCTGTKVLDSTHQIVFSVIDSDADAYVNKNFFITIQYTKTTD